MFTTFKLCADHGQDAGRHGYCPATYRGLGAGFQLDLLFWGRWSRTVIRGAAHLSCYGLAGGFGWHALLRHLQAPGCLDGFCLRLHFALVPDAIFSHVRLVLPLLTATRAELNTD